MPHERRGQRGAYTHGLHPGSKNNVSATCGLWREKFETYRLLSKIVSLLKTVISL